MRILMTIFLFSQLISSSLKAQAFNSREDSLAYSLGVLVGNNLKTGGFGDVSLDILIQGLKTAMKGDKTMMSVQECQTVVQTYAKAQEMKAGEGNKTAGEAFLAANAKRPEVISLPDGLQYEVLKAAEGPKPKETDKVLVHYHGTLIDGTVFDSSVDRGEPIEFPLNQVIKGWTEVVQLMSVGAKWKVYIPYQLAYGERGAGGSIQPYSALIFEIELLEIK